MTQHTPGPWEVLKTQGGGVAIYATPLRYNVLDRTAPGINADANASLIAAAPEMLTIIRQVVEIADGKALHRGLEDDARALLARIEGKP